MSSSNCNFFIKRSSNKNVRSRKQESSSSSDDDGESSVVTSDLQKKRRHDNPMIQSTSSFSRKSNIRKKFRTDKNDDDDGSDDNDEINQRTQIHVSYESTRTKEREGPSDMGATSTLETETERDKDSQSIFQRSQLIQIELADDNSADNVYRGMNNYAQYIKKRDTPQGNASSGFNRKGPIRAPDNIRSTVRWDYQPDICKDYKETGFCGFGDSCKFLHDRSDYKAGWQLEREYEEQHKHRHGQDGDDDDDDPDKYKIKDDDDLPFACFICRNAFKNPVVTRCKHYFCQSCALDHYRKSTRCFVCNVQTSGVFNIAKEIEKRMKNMPKQQSEEQNQNESDDDDNDEEERGEPDEDQEDQNNEEEEENDDDENDDED